jgi:hypothetical protein
MAGAFTFSTPQLTRPSAEVRSTPQRSLQRLQMTTVQHVIEPAAVVAGATLESAAIDREVPDLESDVRIVCFVPSTPSPITSALTGEAVTWPAVMKQISRRVSWADDRGFQMQVVALPEGDSLSNDEIIASLTGADIFLATGLTEPTTAARIAQALQSCDVRTRLVFDSAQQLQELNQVCTCVKVHVWNVCYKNLVSHVASGVLCAAELT